MSTIKICVLGMYLQGSRNPFFDDIAFLTILIQADAPLKFDIYRARFDIGN